jgi:hypothetical protein
MLETDSLQTSILIIIIIFLVGYIIWKSKKSQISLENIRVDDLLSRQAEIERLLINAKEQKCWSCGKQMMLDKANLFGNSDDVISLSCKKCGVFMTWIRKGGNWVLSTETKEVLDQIREKTKELKVRELSSDAKI